MWNFDVICVLILSLFAEDKEGVKKFCSKQPFHFVSIYNFVYVAVNNSGSLKSSQLSPCNFEGTATDKFSRALQVLVAAQWHRVVFRHWGHARYEMGACSWYCDLSNKRIHRRESIRLKRGKWSVRFEFSALNSTLSRYSSNYNGI